MVNQYTPLDLASFDISDDTGFLRQCKVRQLPPYFQAWHNLLEVLHADDPELNEARFRQMVVEMPILDHSSLTIDEALLAHSILSFFAHSYVWRYEVDKKVECLPESICVPWKGVSDMLDLLPAMVYNDVTSTVYRKDESGDYTFDNLRTTVFCYPGDEIMMFAAETEVLFAPALKHIVDGYRYIHENDVVKLAECLSFIQEVIKKMWAVLRSTNTLTTERVYKFALQLIKSWGNEEHFPYQDGLIYEGVSDQPKSFESVSAAQTPIFQVLDTFFGIVHSPASREHYLILREYMLPKHRHFINTLESMDSVLTLVKTSEDKDLIDAYNGCIKEMRYYRSFHTTLVNKYVVKESVKSGDPYSEDLIPSLKATRDATKPV